MMELNLTEPQKGQIGEILKKYQAQQEDASKKMQEVRDTLEQVLTASEFNEANIRQACEQAAPAVQDIIVLKAKVMSEIRGVLTPDQIKILEETRAEMKEKMQKRKEFGKQFLSTWLQMPVE
jgi:Spy/CpxP family protein refolding chaperone